MLLNYLSTKSNFHINITKLSLSGYAPLVQYCPLCGPKLRLWKRIYWPRYFNIWKFDLEVKLFRVIPNMDASAILGYKSCSPSRDKVQKSRHVQMAYWPQHLFYTSVCGYCLTNTNLCELPKTTSCSCEIQSLGAHLIGVDLAPRGILADDHVNLIALSSSSVNWGLSNGMSGGTVICLFPSFFSSVTTSSANKRRMHVTYCWLTVR